MTEPPGHDEQPIAGGTVTPIVRIGDTVRRATGSRNARVHELLLHLEAAGFEGAPRFRGLDDRGREVLTFIEGEVTTYAPPTGMASDGALTAAAVLLRRLHDATLPFAATRQDGWRVEAGAPRGGPVICHNDVGPYNTIYRGGRPVAFIDWDSAAPGPREWDVAYALWRFVPLYDDETCARLGWPVVPRGPRIARFLDAYGLTEREHVLATVRRRQESTRTAIETDPSLAELRREGRAVEIGRDIAYGADRRSEWERFLG
ncbi:phosphotransferase [Paractinoplanes lichenicola]|uniref:Phosphotransferase n=1 Tax=Paractinoplanes lichenicola TaxID=2802976 RepID=A0ABS1VYX7_9ACTN|nr:phosphotransferase [Actinoplanes lichenicola]MBL7259702.1 phosphotransferase [Actinoplanes lichenicola]